MTSVLPGNPVEPAFDAPLQDEIVLVDSEDHALFDDAIEQPVGKRQGHVGRLPVVVGVRVPAVHPMEASAFLSRILRHADVGLDVGRRQSPQPVFKFSVLVAPDVPADSSEKVVGVEVDARASLPSPVDGFRDLGELLELEVSTLVKKAPSSEEGAVAEKENQE